MFTVPVFAVIGVVLLIVIAMLMRPRRFYFIRHGETVLNSEHIRQGEEGELSEKGRGQAEKAAEYLTQFPIDRIVSSTYPRARETAEILNAKLHVPVKYSELLVERKNPTEIIGKPTSDPEVIRIVDQMDNAYHEDDFRYSDEENFVELRRRARKCLGMLSRSTASQSVVITHHHILKMLVAYMLYRNRLHASDFVKLSYFNMSDNAAITVCEFHPWKMWNRRRGWEVISFNEHPK